MTAPHTPAPWAMEEDGRCIVTVVEGTPRVQAQGGGENLICVLEGGAGFFEYVRDEERLANARLIAFAPNLLAFARKVKAHFERTGIIGPLTIEAAALIALATGERP